MENKKVEEYLRKLQDLDRKIEENPDEDELFKEITKIVGDMTNEAQRSVVKKSIQASLKFVNTSNNPDPVFAHEGDSGFDLRAFVDDVVTIPVGKSKTIPTGLHFEVGKGLEVQVRSRSGLAAKNGVIVLNSPGTVDSQYRGMIIVILMNLGEKDFFVKSGDRIAQGVVCPVYGEGNLNMEKVDKLTSTIRDGNGFGSTGVV